MMVVFSHSVISHPEIAPVVDKKTGLNESTAPKKGTKHEPYKLIGAVRGYGKDWC